MSDALPDWKSMDQAERLMTVSALAADGMSASAIAARFTNATRMSVISLCYRRKVDLPSKSIKPSEPRPPRPRKQAATKPRPPRVSAPAFETAPLPEEELGNDATALIGIMDLTKDTCRWPHGDPLLEGFGFCGKQPQVNSPYCPDHSARAGIGYGRGPRP